MATKPKPVPKPAKPPASGSADATIQNAFGGIQNGTGGQANPGLTAKVASANIPGAAALFGKSGNMTGDQAMTAFKQLVSSNPGLLAQLQGEMMTSGAYGRSVRSFHPTYGVIGPRDIAAFQTILERIGGSGIDISQWFDEQSAWNQATGLNTSSSAFLNYPKAANIDSPATLQKAFMAAMEQVQGRMPTSTELAAFTQQMQGMEKTQAEQQYSASSRYWRKLAEQQQLASLAGGGTLQNANQGWLYPQSVPKPNTPKAGPAMPNGKAPSSPGPQPSAAPVPAPNPKNMPPGYKLDPNAFNNPNAPAAASLDSKAFVSQSNSGSGSGTAVGPTTKNPNQPQQSSGRYIDPTSAMHFSQQAATVWGMKLSGTQMIPVGNQDVTAASFTAPDSDVAQEFYSWAQQFTGQNGLYTHVTISGNTIDVTYAKNAGIGAQNAILRLGQAMDNQANDPAAINKSLASSVVDVTNPDPTSQAWLDAWNSNPDRAAAVQNAPAAESAVQKIMSDPFSLSGNPTQGAV